MVRVHVCVCLRVCARVRKTPFEGGFWFKVSCSQRKLSHTASDLATLRPQKALPVVVFFWVCSHAGGVLAVGITHSFVEGGGHTAFIILFAYCYLS